MERCYPVLKNIYSGLMMNVHKAYDRTKSKRLISKGNVDGVSECKVFSTVSYNLSPVYYVCIKGQHPIMYVIYTFVVFYQE